MQVNGKLGLRNAAVFAKPSRCVGAVPRMSVAAASTFDLKKYFSERLPKVEQALEESLAGLFGIRMVRSCSTKQGTPSVVFREV